MGSGTYPPTFFQPSPALNSLSTSLLGLVPWIASILSSSLVARIYSLLVVPCSPLSSGIIFHAITGFTYFIFWPINFQWGGMGKRHAVEKRLFRLLL